MNSKKAITLLVLATLLLSMVPMTFAAVGIDAVDEEDNIYGDTVKVEGDGVPAGTLVEVFWDDTTIAWNGVKGKLNQTTADNDGSYEIWFDVPEATAGDHYIWVKAGGDTASWSYTVLPSVDPDSSSGEGDDRVDTEVYGQAGSKDIVLVFVADPIIANWDWVAVVAADGGGVGETEVDDDLNNVILPGSVAITDGVETFTDDGEGTLVSDAVDGEDGKINYVTGEWEVELQAAAAADLDIDYEYLIDIVDSTEVLDNGETNSIGSWTKRIIVPLWTANAPGVSYYIASLDAKGNTGSDDFTIGAVVTASPDEVNVGDMITVRGRGFNPLGTVLQADVTLGGLAVVIEDYETNEGIDNDGEFNFKIFVPQVEDKEEDYDIEVTDNLGNVATVEVTVNDKASITVTPDYGPQGSTVSISGKNFPNLKEEEIGIELGVGAGDFETFETNSDGTFEGTFRIPATGDGDYEINAFWDSPVGEDVISDTADFRIGSILVLLSDDEGPTGLKVILTGNGFTDNGEWNATFGDLEIFEGESSDATGLLGAMTFYVPQVEAGVYDITVLDVDSEIAVVTEFTVTDATTFAVDPMVAPAGYNITFEGMYWSEEQADSFEFVVYNETDEWDITDDVYEMEDGVGTINPFMTGNNDGSNDIDDGAFIAWWYIGDANPEDAADIFDMGVYTLNVSYGDDWFYQTTFEVGDVHAAIAPRKSTFRIGDTLSFDIEHSFGNNPDSVIEDGVVDIYDPEGELYFSTDSLDEDMWVKSGMYYYVPVPKQVDNENPMVLLDDAPLGEWSYKWLDDDDEVIAEGNFMVEPSSDDIVSGKIDDLNTQITDLQGSISDVTGEFADVQSSIADVSALAADAVAAANAAADAVNAVAATANTASEAAADAAEAANAARDAASGLTTLVYGAIGAALVAALAAIVSLMQISRRIAG
jgi:hypothetical protein